MLNSREKMQESLYSAAVSYIEAGWSVIPLHGDSCPERPKTPAVPWAEYQNRPPTDAELRQWFGEQGFQALGIVCGPRSELVVLDFDDSETAEAFARACPDLINTVTVRSGGRGLPHYYYTISPDLKLSTRHAPGVDLQAGGTYVVAPPSSIGSRMWEIEQDGLVRTLSAADAARIEAFVETQRAIAPAETDILWAAPQDGHLRPEAMQQLYRRLAQQTGRNTALFRTACYLRAHGWTETETDALLCELHVAAPPRGQHAPENPAQRRREARATIRSAYRQPVAHTRQDSQKTGGVVPNSIRERLLQLGQAAAARVLEGLRAAGIAAGHIFTEKLACRLLKAFGIGRRAVQQALKTSIAGTAAFIEHRFEPTERIKQKKQEKGHSKQKKCHFVRGAKRVRISHSQTRGRIPVCYAMPDNAALYRLLGVRPTASDALTPADLASPSRYRQALQRALIARRPGRYSRRWLCVRLGISIWTCRRYDRAAGLRTTPNYIEYPVSWATIGHLSPESPPDGPDGSFLQTPDGKRYPPIQGIAIRLLGRGQSVSLMRQVWNTYTLDCMSASIQAETTTSVPVLQPAAAAQPAITSYREEFHNQQPVTAVPQSPPDEPRPSTQDEQFWLCPDCLRWRLDAAEPAERCRCGQEQRWERIPAAIWRDPLRVRLWWQERCRSQREQRTPRLPHPTVDFRAVPDHTAAWVARLRQSPYARFCVNADQFMMDSAGEQPEP